MTTYKIVPVEPTEEMLTALNRHAVCAGYIEAGYAAMLEAAPSPWRPIAEAPKDWNSVLAVDEDGFEVFETWWDQDEGVWKRYWFEFGEDDTCVRAYPTKFLPWPEPPK